MFGYYLNPERGAIPEWPNRFAVMSWPEWLGFDPIRIAPEIVVPTLLVHSPAAAVPDGARRFHRDLAGPADFLWTQGTQFDFYDQEPGRARDPRGRARRPPKLGRSARLLRRPRRDRLHRARGRGALGAAGVARLSVRGQQ